MFGHDARGRDLDGDALFASLYAELHRLAKRELARGDARTGPGATTLLHEACVEMSERSGASFPDRARFMGYAARVIRGLIVDHARNRYAQQHGGLVQITALDTVIAAPRPPRFSQRKRAVFRRVFARSSALPPRDKR